MLAILELSGQVNSNIALKVKSRSNKKILLKYNEIGINATFIAMADVNRRCDLNE